MERKVLGRGLEALIPADDQAVKERVQMLNVTQIHPSRFQPRLMFSLPKIENQKKFDQPVTGQIYSAENLSVDRIMLSKTK